MQLADEFAEEYELLYAVISTVVMVVADDDVTLRMPIYSFNVRDRISFQSHANQLIAENRFAKYYKMNFEEFCTLRDLLRPYIEKDYEQSRRRSFGKDPILLESIFTMGIRYLAGGSYEDIRIVCGVSTASFYRSVYAFLDALAACPSLTIKFPLTEEERISTASNFQRKSSHGVHRGVISCIDGWLCEIKAPAFSETDNVSKFFSGHYQTFGINVQAGCDANCIFNYVNISCPGGTNDCVAFQESALLRYMLDLEGFYYLLGDNAYPVSEKMLTPFCKSDGMNAERDNYNFYLSQLRIRIEMAFGLLVGKWRIFKRPLEVTLRNCHRIIVGAMILHNFCLRNALSSNQFDNGDIPYSSESEFDANVLPSSNETFPGISVRRNIILESIASRNLVRPSRNILRNA
jgi:hypothetical protein